MASDGFPDLIGSNDDVNALSNDFLANIKSYAKGQNNGGFLDSYATIIKNNQGIQDAATSLSSTGLRGTISDLGGGTSTLGGTGANAAPTTAAAASSTGTIAGAIANYFERGIVFTVGIIFLAVGLSMFKVPVVTNVVGKLKP